MCGPLKLLKLKVVRWILNVGAFQKCRSKPSKGIAEQKISFKLEDLSDLKLWDPFSGSTSGVEMHMCKNV